MKSIKDTLVDDLLSVWVFYLYCIETKSVVLCEHGSIISSHSYEEIKRIRLIQEYETGRHFDIRSGHTYERCPDDAN